MSVLATSPSMERELPGLAPTRDAAACVLRLALGRPPEKDGRLDWRVVFDVAVRERCAVLAWFRSGEWIRRWCQPAVVSQWRQHVLAADAHARALFAALVDCLDALERSGVEATVLKGFPLAERLYGDPFVRASLDLDLHVPAADRSTAHAALLRAGWERSTGEAPWEEVYAKRERQTLVFLEVHDSTLSDRLAHLRMPPPQRQARAILGRAISAHDGPLMPVALAAHLAGHQLPPILWFVDFATLWRGLGDGERAAAVAAAAQVGLGRYLDWAVERAVLLAGEDLDDCGALAVLGFNGTTRADVHPVWRHLRLAARPVDAARLVSALVWPRGTRQGVETFHRQLLRRVHTRWRKVLLERQRYGGG